MTEEQTDAFAALLAEQDPDVYQWITNKKPAPVDLANSTVLKEIQEWARSNPLKYEAKW